MLRGNITFEFKDENISDKEAFQILNEFIRVYQKCLDSEVFSPFTNNDPEYSIVRNSIRYNQHIKL